LGRLSTELRDLAERVDRKPEYSLKLDYAFDQNGEPTNGYCRSDHYMYVIGTVADLDHRPVVDRVKPDPDGVCKQ
jgi:hypothetical protein